MRPTRPQGSGAASGRLPFRAGQARVLLVALFLVSVAIRLPGLERPISKHHEFNTAFFLVPMEIWERDGLARHDALPPYTYFLPNDKDIPGGIGIAAGEKHGTYYYLSFPALSYLVPYGMFRLLHVPPTPLGLRLFNLGLHLLLCLLLFAVLARLFPVEAACVGAAFHLFAPGTLWFHGNGYTHHVFAAFLVVATLHALSRVVFEPSRKIPALAWYSILLFLLFLTEWISVFFALTVVAVMFLARRRVPAARAVIACTIVATALGAGLLFYQYHAFGWEQYLAYQRDRLQYRSTWLNPSVGFALLPLAWLKWTFVSYGLWVPLIAALGSFAARGHRRDAPSMPAPARLFLPLFIVPAVLHHIAFGQFTVEHDYAVIIDALGWAFLLAWGLSRPSLSRRMLAVAIAATTVAGIAQYYFINRPGAYNQNGDPYTIYQDIGETIRRTAAPDETLFITGFDDSVSANNPQIVYYAKRNYQAVEREEDARAFLRAHHRAKGKLYVLEHGRVEAIRGIGP